MGEHDVMIAVWVLLSVIGGGLWRIIRGWMATDEPWSWKKFIGSAMTVIAESVVAFSAVNWIDFTVDSVGLLLMCAAGFVAGWTGAKEIPKFASRIKIQ